MKRLTKENLVERAGQVNPGIEILGDCVSRKSYVLVRCRDCGYEWSPTAGSILAGHGCPICNGGRVTGEKDFLKKLRLKRDDVILVGGYTKMTGKADFKFIRCGHVCSITPSKILSGRGCPTCAKARKGASQRKKMDKVREEIKQLNPYLKLLEGNTYRNINSLLKLQCLDCGHTFQKSLKALQRSSSCPNCRRANTSFFEKFIYFSFVLSLGEEKVLSRDKTAIDEELDIYIPSLNFAVEPGSWSFHQRYVEHDIKKHDLCSGKGIRLIVIYDHYTEESAPFDDCMTYETGFSTSKTSILKLKDIVRILFDMCGLSSDYSKLDWAKIADLAKKDCKRMSTREFNEELAQKGMHFELLDEYDYANEKKLFRCMECGHEWYAAPTSIRLGSGCPRCAGNQKKSADEFVAALGEKNPTLEVCDIRAYVNTKKKIRVRCKKCGYEWDTAPYHLIANKRRTGCPVCHKNKRRMHEEFVAEMAEKSPTIKIIGIYRTRHDPIEIECTICGEHSMAYPANLLNGSGCPKCNRRKAGERRARKVECIETHVIFSSVRKAAKEYHVSSSAIIRSCKGEYERAAGKHWRYVTPESA